jgi:hypothetical protein
LLILGLHSLVVKIARAGVREDGLAAADLTGKASRAATIAGTLSDQSLPVRENTRTRSPSRRAMNL